MTLTISELIQRKPVNFSKSILNHAVEVNDPQDRGKTIDSMVIDLTTREQHIAWGDPCENPFHNYHLDA